eukprot:6237946-Alexandrium_andersonii.AAC.1
MGAGAGPGRGPGRGRAAMAATARGDGIKFQVGDTCVRVWAHLRTNELRTCVRSRSDYAQRVSDMFGKLRWRLWGNDTGPAARATRWLPLACLATAKDSRLTSDSDE